MARVQERPFRNIRIFLVGSDDLRPELKRAAANAIPAALEAGWAGYDIAERLPLPEIVRAQELVERPAKRGRVVLTLVSA